MQSIRTSHLQNTHKNDFSFANIIVFPPS